MGFCWELRSTHDRSRLLFEVEAVAERARPCCKGETEPRKKIGGGTCGDEEGEWDILYGE
jgi:hypothetical protein